MTQKEFEEVFGESLDAIIAAMAEHSEVDPQKFYSMACIIENLKFFSPVLYSAIRKP